MSLLACEVWTPDSDIAAPAPTAQGKSALSDEEVSGVLGESISPYPIVALWLPLEAETSEKILVASIQNTTDDPIEAQAAALVAAPNGRAASVDLGRHTVAGHGSVEVDLSVADLPLQSAGEATTVQVHVGYAVERPMSGAMRLHALHAFAPTRYVTFDPTWQSALVRTGSRQGEEDTRRMQTAPGLRPATSVRLRQETGTFVADAEAVEASPGSPRVLLTAGYHPPIEALPEDVQRVLRAAQGGAP